MAIELPRMPAPRSVVPRLLDFGADIVPPLGGPVQRIHRLGSRYAVEIEMPPMKTEPDGRQWVSRLKRAKVERAILEFPQPSLKIGTPGVPKVKTATAGGTSLPLKGLTPHYAVREGQFLSIVHGGRRYLHSADAQGIADASGDVTLTITPMLRTAVSVDDIVEIAKPMFEGYIEGDEVAWVFSLEHHTGLSFRLVEGE